MSQSEDMVAKNIEKLKDLFPTIVKEGKIDTTELNSILGEHKIEEEEYYNFTWSGKNLARAEATKQGTGTLRPDRSESKNWEDTDNLFIEGDNLEGLKLLQRSYSSRVKMIYIDPPYNTGSDFVYKDNYTDNLSNYLEQSKQVDEEGNRQRANTETDGRFHSNWLNMMYPRLILARNLLTDDGVIFINIDDHEQANLKKLCVEVFGKHNFLANLIWKSGRTSSGQYTNENEYILVFSKDIKKLPYYKYCGKDVISDRTIKRPSTKNPVSTISFPAGIDFEAKDKIYPKKLGEKEPSTIVEGDLEAYKGTLKNPVTIEAAWTMKNLILKWLNGEKVYDQKGQQIKRFYFKDNGVLQYEKQKGTIHPKTTINNISTKKGTTRINTLFDFNPFEFPKPVELLEELIKPVLNSNSNGIILDFFAGSGSTAEAIIKLNLMDGGQRKFIMVQLDEPTNQKSAANRAGYRNIAELSRERIRRAGDLILQEHKDKDGIEQLDVGFKAFKLDSSNITAWDPNPDKLEENLLELEVIKGDRTPEDVLYEILLKYGIDLTAPILEKEIDGRTVFSVGYGQLFVCMEDRIDRKVAEGIINWIQELNVTVDEEDEPLFDQVKVVLKDSGFQQNEVEKTNTYQLLVSKGIEDVKCI